MRRPLADAPSPPDDTGVRAHCARREYLTNELFHALDFALGGVDGLAF